MKETGQLLILVLPMCSLENIPSRNPMSKVDAIKVPSNLILGPNSHSKKKIIQGLGLETVVFLRLVNVPMPKTSAPPSNKRRGSFQSYQQSIFLISKHNPGKEYLDITSVLPIKVSVSP